MVNYQQQKENPKSNLPAWLAHQLAPSHKNNNI